MTDYKTPYSETSNQYVSRDVRLSKLDENRYMRSKEREMKHNDSWKRNSVNINTICDIYAPGDMGHREGVKYVFEGDKYRVVTDMASGYLRIFDKQARKYTLLDGTPTKSQSLSHFKILRREEM